MPQTGIKEMESDHKITYIFIRSVYGDIIVLFSFTERCLQQCYFYRFIWQIKLLMLDERKKQV
jgi:hypothetical protein